MVGAIAIASRGCSISRRVSYAIARILQEFGEDGIIDEFRISAMEVAITTLPVDLLKLRQVFASVRQYQTLSMQDYYFLVRCERSPYLGVNDKRRISNLIEAAIGGQPVSGRAGSYTIAFKS